MTNLVLLLSTESASRSKLVFQCLDKNKKQKIVKKNGIVFFFREEDSVFFQKSILMCFARFCGSFIF